VDQTLFDIFCCPECHGGLRRDEDALVCASCNQSYRVVDGIPRFVPSQNYADNFGLQWQAFRRTQLDSCSGVPISRERFFRYTGWSPHDLKGALVLDIGCGAGRFTEIALSCGARVVAVDYSTAVDACRANHGASPTLTVVQGDLYKLPFKDAAFDFVYCLGVLQHTPDVRRAFLSLPRVVKPGGRLAVDVYAKLPLNALWPKYWLRPLTRRMSPPRLFTVVRRGVDLLYPVSRALGRIPGIGMKLRHALPVVNYEGVYPLSPGQLKEWAVLDTFDMLSPRYDQPQTARTLSEWFAEAPLSDVEVFRTGFIVGRGRKRVGA
jgi:SAM-dependent methyltransferase